MGCGMGKVAKYTQCEPLPSTGTILDEKQENIESNKAFHVKLAFLSKAPLFKRLPKHEHPGLAMAFEAVEFKEGDAIIHQGERGGDFFVIATGCASVSVKQDHLGRVRVATLREGDYFGERALLQDEPRTATIEAETPMKVFRLARKNFVTLGLMNKLQFINRKAVMPTAGRSKAQPPSAKTQEERQHIAECLRSNNNLEAVVHLSESRVEQMIDVMWKEAVPRGRRIISQGDTEADYFYVVQEGMFNFSVEDAWSSEAKTEDAICIEPETTARANTKESRGSDSGSGIPVSRYNSQVHSKIERSVSKQSSLFNSSSKHICSAGTAVSFGELSLLHHAPRAATVTAMTDAVVWVMDRCTFRDILMQASEAKIASYEKHLCRVNILAPLLNEERKELARAMQETMMKKGDLLTQQGDYGIAMHILLEGTVEVLDQGRSLATLSTSEERGSMEVFGERALFQFGGPSGSTAIVVSEEAKALVLDRSSCEAIIGGPLVDPRTGSSGRRTSGRSKNSDSLVPPLSPKLKAGRRILKKDLRHIGLLGCGGFGVVELWEHAKSSETYALKCLDKGYMVKHQQVNNVVREKNILMMTNSPFIIKLHTTYRGESTVELLLEAALGGELFTIYHKRGLFGKNTHARFYLAGMSFAFEHLHERHIIYRDLKPENVLLTSQGHVKLTDMGLAKFVIGKTYTTCGTPEYFAPEVIGVSGHNKAVDWWAMGIFLFELLISYTPFAASQPMAIYRKIQQGIAKVTFPPNVVSKTAETLIKQLLAHNPIERLPMRPGGVKNLMQHEWYKRFDWKSMESLKMQPPYRPHVRSRRDMANFLKVNPADVPKPLPHVDDGSGWDKEFEAGFV